MNKKMSQYLSHSGYKNASKYVKLYFYPLNFKMKI